MEQKLKNFGKALFVFLGGVWLIVEVSNFFVERYDMDQGLVDLLLMIIATLTPTILLLYAAKRRFTKWTISFYILNLILVLFAIRFFLMNPNFIDSNKFRVIKLSGEQTKNGALTSIAVLPFSNFTGDANQEYLVAGMHDDLISEIGSIRNFRVISRTSTLPFSNSKKSIKQIARELNVGSVMESSLSRIGDKITIRLKLFNINPDEQMVWSREFESSLEEIPTLYKEITRSIVVSLNEEISAEEENSLSQQITYNPKAYEAILKGIDYSGLLTHDGFKNAEYEFLKAIELDSTLAPRAYAGLALIWMSKRQMGYVNPIEGAKKVEEYFSKQVSLDSTSRLLEGAIMTWQRYDFENADAAFRYEMEKAPNDAGLKAAYAHFLMIMNRMDEAWEQMNEALAIDPLNPWVISFSGAMYVGEGKVITAFRKFETLADLVPDHPMAYQHMLNKYHLFNEKDKAVDQLKKMIKDLDRIDLDDFIDKNYQEHGYKNTIRAVADTLSVIYETRYVSDFRIHQLYEMVEDRENCIKWMQEMHRNNSGGLPYFSLRRFRKFTDDPRYIQIMEEIGLW